MSTADYTNDRWHVDGMTVTNEDMPGYQVRFANPAQVEFYRNTFGGNMSYSHFARAWLAAQPKPVPEVGMRIEATLRGGAVVAGKVVGVITDSNWTAVYIGPGVTCYIDDRPEHADAADITDWHEVTS